MWNNFTDEILIWILFKMKNNLMEPFCLPLVGMVMEINYCLNWLDTHTHTPHTLTCHHVKFYLLFFMCYIWWHTRLTVAAVKEAGCVEGVVEGVFGLGSGSALCLDSWTSTGWMEEEDEDGGEDPGAAEAEDGSITSEEESSPGLRDIWQLHTYIIYIA